jgi:hypothetical protein
MFFIRINAKEKMSTRSALRSRAEDEEHTSGDDISFDRDEDSYESEDDKVAGFYQQFKDRGAAQVRH